MKRGLSESAWLESRLEYGRSAAVSLEIRKDFVGSDRTICACPGEALEFELYPLGSREPRKDLE